MRLRSAVLDLMRGAAGVSLVIVVGCSGSESIHQDNAATLAPLAAAQPSPALPAPIPSVVLTATAPVVVVAPDVEPVADEPAPDESAADERAGDESATASAAASGETVAVVVRRRRGRPHPIAISAPPTHVARPCGRG